MTLSADVALVLIVVLKILRGNSLRWFGRTEPEPRFNPAFLYAGERNRDELCYARSISILFNKDDEGMGEVRWNEVPTISIRHCLLRLELENVAREYPALMRVQQFRASL